MGNHRGADVWLSR